MDCQVHISGGYNVTLEEKLEYVLRIAEIETRIQHASDKLTDKLEKFKKYKHRHTQMHAVLKHLLDKTQIVDLKDQNLPPVIEECRRKAEHDINKELQNKFGKDVIVFIVCDEKMEEMGFYW